MSFSGTALLVVDVQESFLHRPYWSDRDVPAFTSRLQTLTDGAKTAGIPIVQIFHVEESGAFSLASGYVKTLPGISIRPDITFHKGRHSAFVGTALDAWLVQHGIGRIIVAGIRTEQCCETTTRHGSDLGYKMDFVSEATLTFSMVSHDGRTWIPEEIKARTELVLDGRFARIVTVEEALHSGASEKIA